MLGPNRNAAQIGNDVELAETSGSLGMHSSWKIYVKKQESVMYSTGSGISKSLPFPLQNLTAMRDSRVGGNRLVG